MCICFGGGGSGGGAPASTLKVKDVPSLQPERFATPIAHRKTQRHTRKNTRHTNHTKHIYTSTTAAAAMMRLRFSVRAYPAKPTAAATDGCTGCKYFSDAHKSRSNIVFA